MKKNKGFTLIELLAVIVILGILLSISIVSVNKIRVKQEENNEKNVISSILTGAKNYITENNTSNNVRVKTLFDEGYVDFDKNVYNYLYDDNLNVTFSLCPDDPNKLRRKFIITVKGIIYNDCGCEIQNGGDQSKELCKDN